MNEALTIIAFRLAAGARRLTRATSRRARQRASLNRNFTSTPAQIALATARDSQSVDRPNGVCRRHHARRDRKAAWKLDREDRVARRATIALRPRPMATPSSRSRSNRERRRADQREAGGRRSADQLQARCDARVHAGGLQRRQLPRLGPRQRRLSALALRIRSRWRLLSAHARTARAAHRSFDSERVLAHRKSHGPGAAHGRQPTKKGDPLYATLVRWLESGAPPIPARCRRSMRSKSIRRPRCSTARVKRSSSPSARNTRTAPTAT